MLCTVFLSASVVHLDKVIFKSRWRQQKITWKRAPRRSFLGACQVTAVIQVSFKVISGLKQVIV